MKRKRACVPVRAEGDGPDDLRVALESAELASGGQVPDTGGVVPSGSEGTSVRAKGDGGHDTRAAQELTVLSYRGQLPEVEGTVQ